MKNMIIVYIMLLTFFLAGCHQNGDSITAETAGGEVAQADKPVMETTDSWTGESEESIDINIIPFPIPDNISRILNYSGNKVTLLLEDSNDITAYYQKLIDQGWSLIKPTTSDSPCSAYVNGTEALLIKDQLLRTDGSELEITYYKGKARTEHLKDFDSIIRNSLDYENIHYILEFDIADATKALGLYGFYVFTDKVDPTKLVVDKYDGITKINFDQYLIDDIDFDGQNEFITKLGYGFGRYIITFSVWQYDEEKKELVLAYRTQYEQLEQVDMFLNKSKDGVEVIAGTYQDDHLENQQSYGRLLIKDGILRPEKEDIPFRLIEE